MKHLIIAATLVLTTAAPGIGCTSAIVSATASGHGGTLLWKHRDSGFADNFVDPVEATDSTMAYVALFNAPDSLRKEAWVGFNEAGFAVMNTATYNLGDNNPGWTDREGVIMSQALATCRNVADFIGLLDREINSPKGSGVLANFGVTDASGSGAYIETNDSSYTIFSLNDADTGWMVRSNYSYSGSTTGRLGEVRHDNACHLIEQRLPGEPLTAEFFTEHASRSFYHAGASKDMLTDTSCKLLTDRGEYIPRRSSCASVVIESAPVGENPAKSTTMWVSIGFPAASITLPVTLDSIPASLLRNPITGRSDQCDSANKLRTRLFPRKGKEGKWLINAELMRKELPKARKKSLENYCRFRKNKHQKPK